MPPMLVDTSTQRLQGRDYPLPHLYGHFGLVRLTRPEGIPRISSRTIALCAPIAVIPNINAIIASGASGPRKGMGFFSFDSVISSRALRISLLATGRFLTIAASALKFRSPRAELKVLPVELHMARVPLGIVTLKNRRLSPVAKLFIQHAHEVAKPLTKRK
jgi:hypothetical protein